MARTSCPAPFDTPPMFEQWHEPAVPTSSQGGIHPVTVPFSLAKEEARAIAQRRSLAPRQARRGNIGVSIVRADRELELDQSWATATTPASAGGASRSASRPHSTTSSA